MIILNNLFLTSTPKNGKNRPFLSSKISSFQNEAQCKTSLVKMSFICTRIRNHFHDNGFVFSLALKRRLGTTRKWTIYTCRWQPVKYNQLVHFFSMSYTWYIHTYNFQLYLSLLFPTYFTSLPSKSSWTTAVESVDSVSASSVVETRVALTLVYVCNTIISEDALKKDARLW